MSILSQYHGSLALSIKIFKKIHLQMNSINFNMQPIPSKTLGDHPRKRQCGKDGSFLLFATKCKSRATYDVMLKQFLLQLGKDGSAS